MARYAIYDIETSIYESHGRKANPFDERNYIVSHGVKYQNGDYIMTHLHSDIDTLPTGWLDGVDCIVGINLKFDLLYMWDDPEIKAFFKRGGRIYDCQYARYLVTGQQHKWASMNDMSAIYGGSQKEDKIKQYWQSGVQTIDIPKEELLDYLKDDLDNTEIIFKALLKESKEKKMTKTIKWHMDGLLGTTDMEYNGLKIDMVAARKNQKLLEDDLVDISEKLKEWEPTLPEGCEFNWGSGEHLSALIFGGIIKFVKRMPLLDDNGEQVYFFKTQVQPVLDARGEPVLYKTGDKAGQRKTRKVKVYDTDRPKYRNQTIEVEIKGVTKPKKEWHLAKDGVYKTDAKVIKELATKGVDFAKDLLLWKKYEKDLGTYYQKGDKGMLMMVQDDGRIHHSLNNVQTETGRLSSSKPNLQNCPRGNTSNVREMFVSRFGDSGKVAEIDYSQLEVVVQAFLTRDKNMIRDVNDKVDFHCKRLAYKLHEDYDDVLYKAKVQKDEWYDLQRTLAKGFSFQRAFGAGKKAIAASTGMSEDEVQKLIDVEDTLYPNVNKYNAWVAATVERNATPTNEFTPNGHRRHIGWHPAPTGKRYSFKTYDAPDFLEKNTSFSPTEQKNYSVQGSAGEMVLITLGKLWRRFVETENYGDKAYLINSVHDCVWIDMHEDVVDQVVQDAEKIMVAIPENYKKMFDIDVPVIFRVESEVGPNMKDLGHY